MVTLLLLLAALLALPLSVSADESKKGPKPQWVLAMEDASDHVADCYGAKEDAACAAIVAAYERAMKAPDADDAVRHRLFRDSLHTIAIRGEGLRERGKPEAALEFLVPAYLAMIEHWDGGKHFHTMIENIALVGEVYMSMHLVGNGQNADQLLGNSRGAIEAFYAQSSARRDNREAVADLLKMAILKSEERELDIARFHEERVKRVSSVLKTEERERAIDAYRWSEQWLERATDAAVTAFMGGTPEARFVEIKGRLGALLLDKGDRMAAGNEFLLLAALACRTPEDDDKEHFLVADKCESAVKLWMLAEDLVYDPKTSMARVKKRLEGLEMPRRYINRMKN